MTVTYLPAELNCKLTRSADKTIKNRLIVAQYGDGYEMTAPDGLNSNMETWSLEAAPIKGNDLTVILDFFDSVGAHKWFAWKPFDSNVYKKFKIEKDSLKVKPINLTEYVFTFTLKQVFDLGIVADIIPTNALLDINGEPLYDSTGSIITTLD